MHIPFADLLFWVAVACATVAELLILRSALDPRAALVLPTGGRRPRVRRALELVWTVVPAVVLAAVLVATWHRVHAP